MSQPSTAINTRSGKVLDFANPQPESIDIEDIAAGLAMAPRFGGQATEFHSVAQHAVNVALMVGRMGHPDLELAALHHDSHEAYACDIPRPLKLLLGEPYRAVTHRLDEVIAAAFDFEPPVADSEENAIIKTADDAMFVIEAADFLRGEPAAPPVDPQLLKEARAIRGTGASWSRETAAWNFGRAHRRLTR